MGGDEQRDFFKVVSILIVVIGPVLTADRSGLVPSGSNLNVFSTR